MNAAMGSPACLSQATARRAANRHAARHRSRQGEHHAATEEFYTTRRTTDSVIVAVPDRGVSSALSTHRPHQSGDTPWPVRNPTN